MEHSSKSTGHRAFCVRALVLGAGLLMSMGTQASEFGSSAVAKLQPVSLSLDSTRSAEPSDNLSRADLQRIFKARCPGRVERLLSRALPSERPQFKAVADICACATASMEKAPDGTTMDQFKAQASQAALNCSKDTITTRNESRTRQVLGPYLLAQGLSAQQVTTFSQCAALTHWQNTVDAASESPRAEAGAWWSACTEQVGRKGMPEPQH